MVVLTAAITPLNSPPVSSDEVRIYLPVAHRQPTAVRCSGTDAATPTPEGRGWAVVCGGFGALRDLVRLPRESPEDPDVVLAIGDGTARFSVAWAPSGPLWSWDRPALGEDLTGLTAMYTLSETDCRTGRACRWAVGERLRFARSIGDGWHRWPRPGAETPGIDLAALVLRGDQSWPVDRVAEGRRPEQIEGWAVGRSGSDAFIGQLIYDGAEPVWQNRLWDVHGDDRNLPPLADVRVRPQVGGPIDAWAVGQSGGRGFFVRLEPIFRDEFQVVRWTIAQAVDGVPSELLLPTGGGGWALGRPAAPARREAWLWQLTDDDRGAEGWRDDPVRRFAGRAPLDAYGEVVRTRDGASGSVELLGLTPGSDAMPSVYRYEGGPGEPLDPDRWRGRVPWPDASPHPTETAGALAPLAEDRALYAFGDGVWIVDLGSDGRPPIQVRQRRRLDAVVHVGSVVWVLADGGVRELRGVWLHRPLGRSPHRDVVDLAPSGSVAWALERDGTLWRWSADDAGGRWQRLPVATANGATYRHLATTPDGSLWASREDPDGRGVVARFDGSGWRTLMALDDRDAPAVDGLAVVRAGDGYQGWAVSASTLMRFCSSGIPCPALPTFGGVALTCDAGFQCAAVDAGGTPFVDVAAESSGAVRVVSTHDILTGSPIDGDLRWSWDPVAITGRPACGEPACRVPSYGRLTRAVPGAPGEVWALWKDLRLGAVRAATHVVRSVGGAWQHETVVNTPLEDVAASGSSAWLVGDWTTVLRWTRP